MTAATDTTITRDDIESKLREIKGEVDTTTDQAKSYAMAGAAVVVVAVAAVAFFIGTRRGKKKTTVVEVRRV